MALLLNAIQLLSCHLAIPRVGVWVADLELDLAPGESAPTGQATLTVGADTLLGTVDPRASGARGPNFHVRLVGGAGGWDKRVQAQQFLNPFGVPASQVYSATASAVSERVVVASESSLGQDYVRPAGAASSVLDGASWWVDAQGVTNVGARPTAALPSTADILDWDPASRTATLRSLTIVWPGTKLDDPRFGTATVRDVEQWFDGEGARVSATCDLDASSSSALAGNRIARALSTAARHATGAENLRTYLYRVTSQEGDTISLQSMTANSSMPNFLEKVPIWSGVSGTHMKIKPGSVAILQLVYREPPLRPMPVVVGFDPDASALEVSVDALSMKVGEGSHPVALATPDVLKWIAQISLAVNTLAPGSCTPPMDIASLKLQSD